MMCATEKYGLDSGLASRLKMHGSLVYHTFSWRTAQLSIFFAFLLCNTYWSKFHAIIDPLGTCIEWSLVVRTHVEPECCERSTFTNWGYV
jgi:hypothetical protein